MTGETEQRTDHIPGWWNTRVHLVMMAVSVLAIAVGVLNNLTTVAVPNQLEYIWLLIVPYLLLSVYFDGVTLWRKYHAD